MNGPAPVGGTATADGPTGTAAVHDLAWTAEREPAEVLAALDTTPSGLSAGTAVARLASVGPNVLASRRITAFGVLVRQLRNPLLILILILLLSAAGVSVATGDPTDGLIIAAIVVLSVGLGFVNEYRSELAVAALHANVHHQAVVWRDGVAGRQDVRDLVPGDVVDLAVGDIVPADVRLLEVTRLQCDEGVLTGESLPSAKSVAPVRTSGDDAGLTSVAYMGTIVHQGSGRAVVVGTGSSTAFGQIAVGLTEHQAETAFQVGLRGFSSLLVKVAGVLTVSIFVINVAFSRPLLEALLFSLAIAIGITPQLLPAIVSVSLSRGSRRLAQKRVLVKRLVTIEDLGNIEVLFTDKTGTLTDGTITFDSALDGDGRPTAALLTLGLLCNDATVTAQGPVGGNSLDLALWDSADAKPALTAGFDRLGTLPFDHDRQLASVLVRDATGRSQLITKGAPEAVLARCAEPPPARPQPWSASSPRAHVSSPSPSETFPMPRR